MAMMENGGRAKPFTARSNVVNGDLPGALAGDVCTNEMRWLPSRSKGGSSARLLGLRDGHMVFNSS